MLIAQLRTRARQILIRLPFAAAIRDSAIESAKDMASDATDKVVDRASNMASSLTGE